MDIEITPALAKAVIAAREDREMTQADVTEHGGPSGPTMTKIESGTGTLSQASAKKLQQVFGWPTGEVRRLAAGGTPTRARPLSGDAVTLAQLRTARGWSEIDIANLLHVGPAAVAAWEHGEPIPERHMRIIRDLYAVSVTPTDGWSESPESRREGNG